LVSGESESTLIRSARAEITGQLPGLTPATSVSCATPWRCRGKGYGRHINITGWVFHWAERMTRQSFRPRWRPAPEWMSGPGDRDESPDLTGPRLRYSAKPTPRLCHCNGKTRIRQRRGAVGDKPPSTCCSATGSDYSTASWLRSPSTRRAAGGRHFGRDTSQVSRYERTLSTPLIATRRLGLESPQCLLTGAWERW